MKTVRTTFYLLPVLLWSICPAQDFKKVQNLKLPTGKALVYVYSKDKKSCTISCDGNSIGAIARNKFIYSILDSGYHSFNYSTKGPALNVLIEPNKVYYIVQTQRNTPLMLEGDEDRAEKELESYKLSAAVNTSYLEASQGSDAYRAGFLDSETYYIASKGVSIGNGIATGLTSPIVGLIPALITSGSKPADKNLGITDPNKLNDEEYMKGYRDGAFKKKKKAVWAGYSTGVSIWALIILLV